MTEVELRNSIKEAMPMMKAPQEIVERGLAMARVFDRAVAEKMFQGRRTDAISVSDPSKNMSGPGTLIM